MFPGEALSRKEEDICTGHGQQSGTGGRGSRRKGLCPRDGGGMVGAGPVKEVVPQRFCQDPAHGGLATAHHACMEGHAFRIPRGRVWP